MQIGVVEITAEGRNRLVSRVEAWLGSGAKDYSLLPKLSIRPISPDEIRFQSSLDLCFVGPELLATDLKQITPLRKGIPDTTLIAVVDRRTESLAVAEELARLGVDDVMNGASDGVDVARRIVLIAIRKAKRKVGRTIFVDGWKGGVGVTSVAAGIAEALIDQDKRVCLVDWDQDTQDLSRYLFVRPFLSEDLAILLTQQRAVTAETVKNCLLPVWSGEERLMLLTPAALSLDSDGSGRGVSTQSIARTWLAIKDALETLFDFVVIDASGAPMSLRRAFYPTIDTMAYVVNPDIGGVQAAAQAMSIISSLRGKSDRFVLFSNNTRSGDLTASRLANDALQAIGIDSATLSEISIAFNRDVEAWPGSGKTPYSISKNTRQAFARAGSALIGTLSLASEDVAALNRTRSANPIEKIFGAVSTAIKRMFGSRKLVTKEVRQQVAVSHEVVPQLPASTVQNGTMANFVSHATLSE